LGKSLEKEIKSDDYWIHEAAAIVLNTTPGNIRNHVYTHYSGTQVNLRNLLSKDDLELIKTRLRNK